MPRKTRFFVPEVPVHIVQRGNNRQPVFFRDADRRHYLRWLSEAAERFDCRIHAYVLMTNDVHLLATPARQDSVSRMLQQLGRLYVPYVNRTQRRSGTLWEGRYRASLVQAETYLLTCYRYIELNPVRAGMVQTPGEYPWSSFRCNALGASDPLIIPHPLYLAIDRKPERRRESYRSLCQSVVAEQDLGTIRQCLQTGTPMGNSGFRDKIEQTLRVKVGYARRGRPCAQNSAEATEEQEKGI